MISDTFSLDGELDKCIDKAATIFSRLIKRVWLNKKLTLHSYTNAFLLSPGRTKFRIE